MPNKERPVLVCMSINAALMPQGSTVDQKCRSCDQCVVMAPSGQQFMRDHPDAEIMCFRCWQESGEQFEIGGFAADDETIRREAQTAVPNLHRERN